jgi:hyperosmotically inducible protein
LLPALVVLAVATSAGATGQKENLQVFRDVQRQVLQYPHFTIFDSVSAQVDNGTVTLVARSPCHTKRTTSSAASASVPSVERLVNKIEVLPVSQFDDDLRFRIARAIYSNPNFRPFATMVNPPIHVIVERGRVTLEGVVNSEVDRMLARSIASNFLAFGVKNDLKTEAEAKAELERCKRRVRLQPDQRWRSDRTRPYAAAFSESRTATNDPPDNHSERDRRSNDGGSKQQQRRIENRFRLHSHFHVERLALQSRGERLFPPQDVSALRLTRRRVVIRNLAGDVHLEDDHLASGPAGARRRLTRRPADPLPIHEAVALAIEPVRGPREHPLPLELPHICDIKADMDEPSSAATRQRQARRFCAGHAEQRTNTVAVETCLRIEGRSTPRSATSDATEALTFTVAEPSSRK